MSPEPSIFSSTIRRSSAPVIWIYLQYIFPPLGSALCAIHDRLVPFILLFVVNYWITLFREIRIPSRRVVWTQNLCRLPFVPQIELPLETTLNFNLISGEYCALPRETKKTISGRRNHRERSPNQIQVESHGRLKNSRQESKEVGAKKGFPLTCDWMTHMNEFISDSNHMFWKSHALSRVWAL